MPEEETIRKVLNLIWCWFFIDNDRCFLSVKVRFNFKVFPQCLLKSFNLLKCIPVDLSIGEELGDCLYFVFTRKGGVNQWMFKQIFEGTSVTVGGLKIFYFHITWECLIFFCEETLAHAFSCEVWVVFINTYFIEHLCVTFGKSHRNHSHTSKLLQLFAFRNCLPKNWPNGKPT